MPPKISRHDDQFAGVINNNVIAFPGQGRAYLDIPQENNGQEGYTEKSKTSALENLLRADPARVVEAVIKNPDLLAQVAQAVERDLAKAGTWAEKVGKKSSLEKDDPAKIVTARWKDQPEGADVLAFTKEHYGRWMNPDPADCITFTDIAEVDKELRVKLRNHLRRHDFPDGFYVTTRELKNTALVENAKQSGDRPSDRFAYRRLTVAASKRGISLRP